MNNTSKTKHFIPPLWQYTLCKFEAFPEMIVSEMIGCARPVRAGAAAAPPAADGPCAHPGAGPAEINQQNKSYIYIQIYK